MKTQLIMSTAVTAILLPLTACGSQDGSSGADEEEFRNGVRLSVPDSAKSSSLNVVVEQAGLEAGDEVAIYAYRTAFDETDPACQGDAEPVGRLSVSGDGVESVSTTLSGEPGRYWWQVIAPGYASECGTASTIYKASPDLGLVQEDNSGNGLSDVPNQGEAGKPYEFGVAVYNAPPEDDLWVVDVEWYGPFDSTPEAVAAGCGEGVPIGTRATVEVAKEGDHKVQVTPDAAGVYRVVAHTEETAHASAATTGCDEYSPFVAIR